MLYDLQQRIFFGKTYYESKSINAVQRAFVNKHNLKSAPKRKSILAAVKNFEKNGNVTCVDERKGKKSAKRINAELLKKRVNFKQKSRFRTPSVTKNNSHHLARRSTL